MELLCIELSNNSKDTFWIGQHDTPTCELEYFAKAIFEKYTNGLSRKKDINEFENNEKRNIINVAINCDSKDDSNNNYNDNNNDSNNYHYY